MILRRAILSIVLGALIGWTPTFAVAQQESSRPVVWDIARGVLFDPTTYGAAVISYTAKRQDWRSSQVLFEHGWLEENPLFTVSGRPNDAPLTYARGENVIRKQALGTLQLSVANNLAAGTLERVLIARYPDRRKLIRTLSWVERISFAASLSYLSSVEHFRQVGRNRRLAREHGLN